MNHRDTLNNEDFGSRINLIVLSLLEDGITPASIMVSNKAILIVKVDRAYSLSFDRRLTFSRYLRHSLSHP